MNAAPPANVVLVTIDCWRGDHLGATGCDPSPTPHLDRLAAAGTVFEQAITAGGWTRPAMMALFSSVFASRHQDGSLRRLSPDFPVLAEMLRENGYATAGYTANPVCGRSGGFERGFGTFVEPRSTDRFSNYWLKFRKRRGFSRLTHLVFTRPLVHRLLRRPFLPEITASARQLTGEALAWLRQAPAQPFFLWLHYIDLHWPYRYSLRPLKPAEAAQAWRDRRIYRQVVKTRGRFDPGRETRQRWQTLYREELGAVDAQVGALFAELRASGRWENTLVAVTSDHGEEFFEHRTWAHSWNQLFDEGVHVPLILKIPGSPGGQHLPGQVSLLDVTPTILDLAGIVPPERMTGLSLRPLIERRVPLSPRPPALTEMLGHRNSYRYRLAVRTETHRYIHDFEKPRENQLYDRGADPCEERNLYARADNLARTFDELRFAHVSSLVPKMLEFPADDALAGLAPEIAERLRELGYIS